ncbi:MAG: Crp/Fnr family transcriptional regulator [Rhodothermales bacterium]
MDASLLQFISQYVTLTDDEADALMRLDLIRRYPKQTTLLRTGETTRNSFFVLQGCVVRYYLVDGERKVTAIYTEHESIGPPVGPSPYELYVIEDSVLSVADDETTARYLQQFPKLETMCRMMAEQMLLKSQVSFDQYRTTTPEQRYQRLEAERPDLLQRVPQYYLASYLGIRPESLSRIRKRLATQAA